MCIKPIKMRNPRYYKDGRNIRPAVLPIINKTDHRLMWVTINCGQCHECRREKSKEWQIRLTEEYKSNNYGQFVTLTISDYWGQKIAEELKTNDSEKIAKRMVYLFRERWRKKFKKSPRHFLITELGHKGTQRLHLHGIIFETEEKFGNVKWINEYNKKLGRISENLTNLWKFGHAAIGYSNINEKMITYITKYITKIDTDHKGFYGTILTSPGMGERYTNENKLKYHKFNKEKTKKKYKLNNGAETTMPQYYKNKLWTTKQKEELRLIEENKNKLRIGKHELEDNIKGYRDYLKGIAQQNKRANELQLIGEKKEKYNWKNGTKIEEQNLRIMVRNSIQKRGYICPLLFITRNHCQPTT